MLTKMSEETDRERQYKLQNMREFANKKRKGTQNQTNKRTKKFPLLQSEKSQNDYVSAFDISENGGIKEQSWAKTNMNKFHKSLKSKPKTPYVCSQCSRNKKSLKKFSVENSMIPSSIPDELKKIN